MTTTRTIRIKRVYDAATREDGVRVLVDRIWPRGLTKERARLHEWCKDLAPSTDLRTWYHHDPDRFEEFERRYLAELASPEHVAALQHLRELARQETLTLLTATRRADSSGAAVLADLLRTS